MSGISKDEQAYGSYERFCLALDQKPMSFEEWYRRRDGINPELSSHFEQFHGYPANGHKHEHYYGGFRNGAPPESVNWDGTWDNIIRALEDKS